jgi:hypothetical protein
VVARSFQYMINVNVTTLVKGTVPVPYLSCYGRGSGHPCHHSQTMVSQSTYNGGVITVSTVGRENRDASWNFVRTVKMPGQGIMVTKPRALTQNDESSGNLGTL